MKKPLIILLTAFTSFANAQTTQTRVIDPVTKDTVLITNTATTVSTTTVASTAKVYRYTPPVVVPPPVVVTPVYNKTFRYSIATNAYRLKDQPQGIIKSIPPAKGSTSLPYSGSATPGLGLPTITKEGLLFIDNQANTQFGATVGNSPMYPRESWMILYKPDYFMFEKLVESGFYIGDLGNPNGIRFTNDDTNTINWNWFPNATWPVNQPFVLRTRLTLIPGHTDYVNVEFWIDNVKQTATVPIKTWYRNNWPMGIGTDTNNEYIGWYEWFETNRALTDAEASTVYNEIVAEYGIGKATLPYADNITFSVVNGQRTASYKYFSPDGTPEDVTKRQIKWIDWQGLGPAGSIYRPEFNNMITVPDSFKGRVSITVYDTNGKWFSIPASKDYE